MDTPETVPAARQAAFDALGRERHYQDRKWGTIDERYHELPGWFLIMRKELEEAESAWCKGSTDDEALRELLQVVAVGLAALEQHGVVERVYPDYSQLPDQFGRK